MSETTRILFYIGLGLALIYGALIRFSLTAGQSIIPYLICIAANIAVILWFFYIATRPSDDPQAGMGLGPIMLICLIITIIIPVIAIIFFFVRKWG